MNKISKSYKILKEEGVQQFAHQFRSYITDLSYQAYFKFKNRETVEVGVFLANSIFHPIAYLKAINTG